MISGALPFAVWNLKGYLDTIPKELEEAGKIDGANSNQIFWQIVLPLAIPQLAVTFFLGFIGHWQEFVMPWLFLTNPGSYTLSMTLYNMVGRVCHLDPVEYLLGICDHRGIPCRGDLHPAAKTDR